MLDRKRIVLDDIQLGAETEYPDTLELLKINTVHSCAENDTRAPPSRLGLNKRAICKSPAAA